MYVISAENLECQNVVLLIFLWEIFQGACAAQVSPKKSLYLYL